MVDVLVYTDAGICTVGIAGLHRLSETLVQPSLITRLPAAHCGQLAPG